tara:strand:- start:9869 stop:10360 length:492 start_codon:yes stop_codon:yes gene_type:complete
MSIPQEVLAGAEQVADEQEAITTDVLMGSAPRGQFSASALNQLVDEVNKILPKMGMPLYPTFTEDITVFPPEFVDVIIGLAGAADAAGVETLIELDGVESDRELAVLAGAIGALAEEEAFLEYIAGNMAPEEEIVEEETVVEEPLPGGGEEVIEDEELFMQRM